MAEERICIDLDVLKCAMQDHGEIEYFLDLETGEVTPKFEADMVGEDGSNEELIENNPDRFRPIESVPSWRSFEIMEEFVWQLPEGTAKYKLGLALQERKPFRKFKDRLHDFGPVREQWFAYEMQVFAGIAKEWLDAEEIEATLDWPGNLNKKA